MKTSTTIWQAGELIDAEPRPRRPLLLVALVVALVLAFDLVLSLSLTEVPVETRELGLDNAHELRRELTIAAESQNAWVLLGDSVLAGDVMEGEVEDWEQHRVVDYMRRQASHDSAVDFHQVALNGLLPIDMLRIVEDLDRVDPRGKTSLMVEINPRYFSRHYVEERTCTREWLCALDPETTADGDLDWLNWLGNQLWNLDDQLGAYTPVYRHRDSLGRSLSVLDVPDLAVPHESAEPDGDVLSRRIEGRARLLDHYRDPVLDGDESVQAEALEQILVRLKASKRRAIFFHTPVEDAFMSEAVPEPRNQGEFVAELSRMIVDLDHPEIEFVSLDHPLFVGAHFLDHVHFGAEGNRLLAINLLKEAGIGLNHTPSRSELVFLEDSDMTMINRVNRGYSNGAPWQTMLGSVDGVAVDRGGKRFVIADGKNDVLRVLEGKMQTTRLLAGTPPAPIRDASVRPTEASDLDGPALEAYLDDPASPCWHDDALFFTTSGGAALRRLENGFVTTEILARGKRWRDIQQIRSSGGVLYLLDSKAGVLAYDPTTRTSKTVVRLGRDQSFRAFDVSPGGRIFIADAENRIWSGHIDPESSRHMALREDGSRGLVIEYSNAGRGYYPEEVGRFFPFPYPETRFDRIRDLHYIERYGGLLVQEQAKQGKKLKTKQRLTETIHLRFLSLADDRVYPWVKPQRYGQAYLMHNTRAETFVSPYHKGSMAIEQETATLFYAERYRSRAYRIGDGLFGLSQVGHTPSGTRDYKTGVRELYSTYSGTMAQANFQPDRHLGDRIERLPRKGPYQIVVLTGSMSNTSDQVGPYSLVRVIGDHLREDFGLREGMRVETIQRSYGGVRFVEIVQALEEMVTIFSPDVVLIELQDSRGLFRKNAKTDAQMTDLMARIDSAARQHDALVLFYDNTGLVSRNRDGLRPARGGIAEFDTWLEDSGYEVIQPSDVLLQDHLGTAPWGSVPFRYNHGSVWSINVTGERLATMLHPRIKEHLEDREPAFRRERAMVEAIAPGEALPSALAGIRLEDEANRFPAVSLGDLLRERQGDHLLVFLDLGKLDGDARPSDEHAEDIALAVAHAVITEDPSARRTRTMTIRLASFSNYDEYGSGVRESAQVLFDRTFDRDQLEEFASNVLSR